MSKDKGTIIRVTGPLVKAKGMKSAKMYELVKISKEGLLGEVIELSGDIASIQVYEETAGVGPGEDVILTGRTMSCALAPGLLESIYDGVQRPLAAVEKESNSYYIKRGVEADPIDMEKKWEFTPVVAKGEAVSEGDVLGEVPETTLITHKVMVPPGVSGEIVSIEKGSFNVTETIATIKTKDGEKEIAMLQYWPIRNPRPFKKKLFPKEPLLTGFRTIDTFSPIVKGGAGSIPGPFGSGKTVTQQGVAKYCDAQVIVYIGCGERGNEMTEVLDEFPHLVDPNSGEKLMKRTVLIANTSNMPVAAREASVYTGITIAEYYRDMGYSVALMADSTSRWAEAMREISGRLEEMPGEEGYPAYLASRTAEFYERAGSVSCLGNDDRKGALTVIGAVSPPGGDLSEPVSQATLRVTKTFWGLDATLAYKKHFPAINWLTSYSLYVDNLKEYWKERVGEDFEGLRSKALEILQEESKLMEIVRLVGMDSLSDVEKLTLEVAKKLREEFLYQNAFDEIDAYTSLARQYYMLRAILALYSEGVTALQKDSVTFADIAGLSALSDLPRLKALPDENVSELEQYAQKVKESVNSLN